MQTRTIKKITDKIRSSKKFLITAHMNLEGDALGSELGMYLLLRKLGKKAVVFNNDPTPAIYSFLPYSRFIKKEIKDQTFDAALVLDCSDSTRSGRVKNYLTRAKCIINIDHHISNTFFGDINWVDPLSGSAAQMIYQLCEKFKVMDKNIALCLYTGIFTDTGNFTYSNVNAKTHKVVAELMKYNLHPNKIYDNIHSLCVPADLSFIGRIISSLRFDADRNICWATISNWPDKSYDLTEVIFSVTRLLREPDVFVLFKKVDAQRTRVNLRSRSKVDVNRIAKFFGGGGHKRASGTTLEAPLAATEKKVISFIKRYTNGSKSAK
jgi:bifunctional oligoribonuclease and PAP phosphatase NrnA